MASEKKKRIALVRGDSLNTWEGVLWEQLSDFFDVTGFCTRKNLYATDVAFPVKRLHSSTDSGVLNPITARICGRFQWMFGLEREVSSFDIVHTSEISYFYTTQAVRAKKLNPKLKVVTTVWDNSFGRFEYNYWPLFSKPPRFWLRTIYKHRQENIDGVDMFLPVSAYSADMLRDLGVPEKKIQIVTPAVVVEKKNPEEDIQLEELLHNHAIQWQEKKIFLSVNRLVKEKGVYDVLYAWKIFFSRSTNQAKQLIFIGKGREEENLKRLVREFGLSSSVRFIDSLPNRVLRRLYSRAHVLILGSIPNSVWQEQFGYVAAEAITNNCPVLSTYSGAIPEVVGRAGILVPPAHPPALADALESLENMDVYAQLKKECLLQRKNFLVEEFIRNTTEVYKKVLQS